MPIIATDAISGSIYVVAASADEAQLGAVDFLSGNQTEHVFGNKKDAIEFLRDPFRPHLQGERVYVVTLDIRADPTE
ncbi:hypothetical protein [Streptomyces sp. NPDC006355]|uniref:hypothetical protein n=1 Tax=Streptomyces sp. NPDC006355 TaxID=3156758 RepID=UPI0033A936A9